MKKVWLVPMVCVFFACSKKDNTNPVNQTNVVQSSNILYQEIDGTVATDHSYEIRIHEEVSGTFIEKIINTYTQNSFPFYYKDNVNPPFFYELTLHNNSTFSNSGKGYIRAMVVYKGDTVLLEADENTWSKRVVSQTYTN